MQKFASAGEGWQLVLSEEVDNRIFSVISEVMCEEHSLYAFTKAAWIPKYARMVYVFFLSLSTLDS